MQVVEAVGRTIDEAIREALKQLGAEAEDVDVEIVDEGSKGLFGLLGARRARVRVKWKPGVKAASATEDDESGSPDGRQAARHERPRASDEKKRSESEEDKLQLQQKIDNARQFVAGVLERLDVEAALETREDDDGIVHIHIVGDDLGLVIGRRGQTLDALQFLVNQAVNKDGGVRARIVLDAGGYRDRRKAALEALAGRMRNKALRQRRKIVLEPMNAFERRIVHLSLVKDDAVETYSEGEDPHRRIVIAPKE